jgi:tricorn protease
MSAAGGEPRRLAYNGGWAETVGWTRDGRQVVFVSSKLVAKLFSMSAQGGPVSELPPPSAVYGSFSPDGRRIAYLPFGSEFQGWKGYRGGSTPRIWIADLPDCRIEKIPRENSNDFNPMWVGDRIYFLSDRDGLISLFAYDVASRTVNKIIDNPESDVPQVVWYVDGAPFQVADYPYTVRWRLAPGDHVFQARLIDGRTVSSPVRVLVQ